MAASKESKFGEGLPTIDAVIGVESQMEFDRAFLIGAPRSGTSWLQSMLGSHPKIASPTELHIFDMYLKHWHRAWKQQAHPPKDHDWRRFGGLASVLTRQDFDAIIAQVVDTIHRRVMEAKPSATVLLEKTPDYSLHVADIARYFPEARFIHLIRDGRDVAASLLAASAGWGRMFWDGESIESAADRWQTYVLAARSAVGRGEYLEVRYENLRSEAGAQLLQEVFRFCGIDASDRLCSEIYGQHRIETMRYSSTRKVGLVRSGEMARKNMKFDWPDGFFRRGTSGGWKDAWSTRDCWRFDRVAGGLLRELGYADPGWARVSKFRELGYHAIERMKESRRLMRRVARQGKRILVG